MSRNKREEGERMMDGGGADGRRPRAVFMAFGTKGDVFPIAALAAAFAREQQHYTVVFITHSAHQSLSKHLAASNVRYMPVSSPPVLAAEQLESGSCDSLQEKDDHEAFKLRKKVVEVQQRKECLSYVEEFFGNEPSIDGDFIVINFFALEGWHLAEVFQVKCIIAAPYFVPYSSPTSFERQFKLSFPLLYKYFQEAPPNTVCWTDILHWMWPLFMETWGSWRNDCLSISPVPFTDPVTYLPMLHVREESPLLLYGFSKEVVERPGYWPSGAHICGFWFLPMSWQFSCDKCMEFSTRFNTSFESPLCANHSAMEQFLMGSSYSSRPIFVGLSSMGSMGFLRNPKAFLMVLKTAMEMMNLRFILFSSGYKPLDSAIQSIASSEAESSEGWSAAYSGDSTLLFNNRLFCFSGSIPYSWLFPRCAAAIHHAGSGSTAAALVAGIPQIVCPFLHDQFYWAERLHWLGVAPEPLQREHLVPEMDVASSIHKAADVLLGAISSALSPEMRAQAAALADRLSLEDGIGEALRVMKEKVLTQNKS